MAKEDKPWHQLEQRNTPVQRTRSHHHSACTHCQEGTHVPKRCPFKAEGRQYGANLKEKITPSKGTYIPKRRPFKAEGRQYRLDLENLEQGEELSLDNEHWIDAEWDCLEEQCREMVLEVRRLEALEDEQNVLGNAQTQEETPALASEPRTPSAFIEEVLGEESTIHIETMDTEHMDTHLPKEEIPRLDPDMDNNDPEEGPQGESDEMADNGNPWLGTPDGDDLIITYVRGEPVISIFKPEQTPLAEEYFESQMGYS